MSARTEARLSELAAQLAELREGYERLATRVRQLEAGDSRERIVPPPFLGVLRDHGYPPPDEPGQEDPP